MEEAFYPRSYEINKVIVECVNKMYKTTYEEVNDEVFNKFFNSDIFYDDKMVPYLVKIHKWSYEAMIYLSKNITDYVTLYRTNYSTYINNYTDILRLSITNFNYIINKIVEWTISDETFNDFIEQVKDDRKFNSNLLTFVITSIGYALYHTRYILYIIYKYAEAMGYETIIYLYDINIGYNISKFDKYYKELINNKFSETLFPITSEDEEYCEYYLPMDTENKSSKFHNVIREIKRYSKHNYLLQTLLYYLEQNELKEHFTEQLLSVLVDLRHEYKIRFNCYVILFNYLILSRRTSDLKTMLLTTDINSCLLVDVNNLSSLGNARDDQYYCSNHLIYDLANIDYKNFMTIEVYRTLLFMNVKENTMQHYLNPFTSINIEIHNNYYENYIDKSKACIPHYKGNEDKDLLIDSRNRTLNIIKKHIESLYGK